MTAAKPDSLPDKNSHRQILHIHPYLKALNGSERLLIEMVRAWPSHDIHRLVTIGQAIQLPADIELPIKTTWATPPKDSLRTFLWGYLVLSFTALRGQADIIVAHSGAAIFPAAVRRLIRGGRLIFLCHEPPRFLYDLWSLTLARRGPAGRLLLHVAAPIIRAIDRWSVSKADISLVLSKYSAKQFKDIYGYDPIVTPAGIDFETFRQPIKSRPGLNLITVSKLHPRKNIALLLKALATDQLTKAKLVVVGSGPQANELKALADELSLLGRVDWRGTINDMELQTAYHHASVFVFCAYFEPFGLVVLEAMAMGLPVVVPNEGGPQEIVGQGKYGFVYKQDDVSSLASAIVRASQSSNQALARAQAHAQTYSWAKYAELVAKATKF